MKSNKIIKAFTLIELLVVITIIGILATGAATIYTSQIQKARDATRISSIKSLQGGVEQYYQDTSLYPSGRSDWLDATSGVVIYLPELAEDPKHDETCNGSRCGYIYTVGSDSNGIAQGIYELSTAFENQGNIDNKAAEDSGDDDFRLEVGLELSTLDTSQAQATAFTGGDADAATVVIVKNNVVIK